MKRSSVPPTYYADWIKRHAAVKPAAVAIVTPKVRLTYDGLYRVLHRSAFRLVESGIEAGQTIALCLANPALHTVLVTALNRLGCATVTLPLPEHAGAEIELPAGIAIDCILLERPFAGATPSRTLDVHVDWLAPSGERVQEWTGPGLSDADMVAQFFTSSGTTGTPKAIALSTRQLEARTLKRSIGILGLARSGKTISFLGMRTQVGYSAIFATLFAGGTAYLGWAGEVALKLIAEARIDRIEASPVQYQGLLECLEPNRFDLSSLRIALVTGSATPARVAARIRSQLGSTLLNNYGSTELGTTSFGMMRANEPRGSCGHVAPWMSAEVVDDDDRVLPAGEVGNLRFRCEDMATEYLNDPEASALYFRDGWFYPGDIGAISPMRALSLSGRNSEQINAGGLKIAPDVVESVVASYPGIKECAAFGMPDALGLEKVWAAIVASGELDIEALDAYCRNKLTTRAPTRFLTVAELPRNDMGKVLRRALQQLARESVKAGHRGGPPRQQPLALGVQVKNS